MSIESTDLQTETTVAGDDAGLHCEFSADDFRASASIEDGVRTIRVTGGGLCPSAGWSLALTAANPGVVPHPESLWLQLAETPPEDASARVLTDTDVETVVEDDAALEVVIRFGWREPITVPVIELDADDPAGEVAAY
ncbi:hypothetical protein ACDF64_02640 [Agromyces sp. MMS24-JH15]|uniref:hypothetical protein n=1 Tax=Agromyces sp. MMS24-JH15 TaxID=3243765 RepID=UPI0037493653